MTDIDDVARRLRDLEGPPVVFLTGAGLSVASGIAPYRKSKDAVWSRIIMDWGTIEKFHEDPLAWWKEFWIKAHGPLSGADSLSDKHPNPGHDAITTLVKRRPDNLVVTQNIDGLHRRAGVPEDQLVEIHGRHDRFVCTSDGDCRRRDADPLTSIDLTLVDAGKIPVRDLCGAPLRPLVLLFDEMYDSRRIYQARKARHAFNDAGMIIFVGTSFSVGITDYALRAGLYAKAVLVNVNVESIEGHGFVNLIGPAEEVLPELVRHVEAS